MSRQHERSPQQWLLLGAIGGICLTTFAFISLKEVRRGSGYVKTTDSPTSEISKNVNKQDGNEKQMKAVAATSASTESNPNKREVHRRFQKGKIKSRKASKAVQRATEQKIRTIGSHKTIRFRLQQDQSFRGLTQFNSEEGRRAAGKKHRLWLTPGDDIDNDVNSVAVLPTNTTDSKATPGDAPGKAFWVLRWFGGSSLMDRLARSIARRAAMDMKEFVESVEFFQSVRKHCKRCRTVVDLCCGHGFTGLLFAIFVRGTASRFCEIGKQ